MTSKEILIFEVARLALANHHWREMIAEILDLSDAEMDQVGAMPASVIDKLYEHCQRLSGLGAKDAEELEKN